MTPLRRLVLFAACAAAAGNNTTRATKETKPADQPLVDYGVNQTRAVNETKPAATDQTFVQNAATGVNQTNAVDGTTSTDGTSSRRRNTNAISRTRA